LPHFRPLFPTLQALIALLAAGCTLGDEDKAAKPATSVLIDEQAGSLLGVRFGDTEDEVRARLGEPTDDYEGVFPEGEDYTGPQFIPSPASDAGLGTPKPLHYRDAAFLVSPTAGVFAMITLDDDARTKAGVEIGNELAKVRKAYGRVECGEAVGGEPVFGGETPTYPWCLVRGKVRVFFGEDPIDSIMIRTTAARG
jgi:hypothetical protein